MSDQQRAIQTALRKNLPFSNERRRLLCALSLIMLRPNLTFAKVENSLEYSATVKLLPNATKTKINTNVSGVCLMHPPFDALENELKKWRGRSVRVWAHSDYKWWSQLLPTLRQMKPSTLLLFNEAASHPEQVIYDSLKENNLNPNQRPDAVVWQMKFALSQLESIGLARQPLYWEAWNEPQFAQNGNWQPEAMARYVNHIALASQQAGLPFRVLAPLHMNPAAKGQEWNERLCQKLDSSVVAGLVNHYYNWGWFNLDQPQDEFLRRAGEGPLLRERVRLDSALISRYGKGRWSLHCSEWNVHPETYKPPYYSSRDMAAALYAFSAVKVYLEEGLDSAQFFLLTDHDSHFAAYTREGSVVTKLPTGAVMEWLGEKLQGELLSTNVECPSFRRGNEFGLPDFDVPFLEVIATQAGSLTTMLLANKDPLRSVNVTLKGMSGKIIASELMTPENQNRERTVEVQLTLDQPQRIPHASILTINLSS